jgi:hypothetical protein
LFEDDPLKDQILEGKFIFGGDSIFNYQDILEAEDKELNDGVRRVDGNTYVIGIDTAIGSDEMVYTVLDSTQRPFKLVKMVAAKGNSKSPQLHLNDFLDLFDTYRGDANRITVMLETWNGESVRFYHDLPPHVQAVTRCYGSWQPERRITENKNQPKPKNHAVKKADLLLSLKKLLAAKELKIPANNAPLTQQLSIYKEKDDNIPTDRVMSLALAAWLASETAFNQEIRWMKWK